jgi:hypothetical protein
MSPVYRLADAISDAALLRRRLRRKQATEEQERRGRFIREYVPGRSFVDVGGMYGIDGDVAFQAEAAGATRVTLFDSLDPTPRFLERHRAQGSAIRTVQGDLEDPVSMQKVGEHDVVYCSGVIYHTPNLLLQLTHLHSITREHLLLGSATIPEIPGVPQACVYYPFLEAHDRAPWARGWRHDPEHAIGVGTAFDPRPMYGHANCWWGITPSALRAMVRSARFEIVDEYRTADYPWGMAVVAKPVAEHPSLPPVDYYRLRGQKLAEGTTLPFDGYYDKGPDARATPEDAYPDNDGFPPFDIERGQWRRAFGRLLRSRD